MNAGPELCPTPPGWHRLQWLTELQRRRVAEENKRLDALRADPVRHGEIQACIDEPILAEHFAGMDPNDAYDILRGYCRANPAISYTETVSRWIMANALLVDELMKKERKR